MSSDNNSPAFSAVCNGDVAPEGDNSLSRLPNHSPAPSAVSNGNFSAEVEEPLRRLSVSSANHSLAPSAVSNGNVSAKGKKPLRRLSVSSANHSPASSALSNGSRLSVSSANHSPASSAVSNGNVSAEENNHLRRLHVPWANHSPAPSAVYNGNVLAEEKMPAWGGPFNEAFEADPSIVCKSAMLPSLSDYTLWSSPQWSYSGDVLQRPLIPNHYYNSSSNGVCQNGQPLFPPVNVRPLGLAYGPTPFYREEPSKVIGIRGGGNRRQSGYGYRHDHDRRHERMPNYYSSLNGMVPHTPLLREQLPPYQPPLCSTPFIGNPLPSTWSAYPGHIGITYVPVDVNHYPAQPQVQYFSGPSFVPRQEINAAQQSPSPPSLDDLRARLRRQIGYYFSLENLVKDGYLKAQMDEHGWVPVTLIVKFRRVQQLLIEKQKELDSFKAANGIEVQEKSLTNNEQFILDSLRPSDDVEVEGDKMRKRHEWERWVASPQQPEWCQR